MFLSNLLPLSRKLTPSLSYHIIRKQITKVTDFISFWPFGISIFPFLTIGISMYQKRILPHFIILLLSYPKLLPLWSGTDRRTDGRTAFFTPSYISSFFSLNGRGPTRRRNSTGLAELWCGWPIEQVTYLTFSFH
jgi:hypothetical protein